MISINTVGRVTADIEAKDGKNGARYAKFSIAVPKGYGDKKHTIFFDVIAFDHVAKRLEAAGVKKASYIFVTGDLDVVEFTRKDGTKGQKNEIELHSWSYVNGGKGSEKSEEKKKIRRRNMTNTIAMMKTICLDRKSDLLEG